MVRKRRKNIEKWKKTKKWVGEKRKGKSELEGVAKKEEWEGVRVKEGTSCEQNEMEGEKGVKTTLFHVSA